MEYNFREIEPKWQKYWVEHQTYKVVENKDKEKFSGRAICHTNRTTPSRYHGGQYQPLP